MDFRARPGRRGAVRLGEGGRRPRPGTGTHGKAAAGSRGAWGECVSPSSSAELGMIVQRGGRLGDTHSPRGSGSSAQALP